MKTKKQKVWINPNGMKVKNGVLLPKNFGKMKAHIDKFVKKTPALLPPKKQKVVKGWAVIDTYDGNLIAYEKRGKDWSYAIFPSKEMILKVENRIENVKYKKVPCSIIYQPL